MILRVLNLCVIGALILAAAYVYRIKFDATVQAERLAKLRSELRRERDSIAALRAEWGQLDNPARVEALTKRYLQLRPVAPTQFDSLDRLPERPAPDTQANGGDPIGGLIENFEKPATLPAAADPPPGVAPAPLAPATAPAPAAAPARDAATTAAGDSADREPAADDADGGPPTDDADDGPAPDGAGSPATTGSLNR
jgi:hypothetical protein